MEELLHQFDSMMLDLPLTSQDFQDVKTVLESLQKCFKGVSMQSLRRSVDSGIDQGSTATRTISTTSTRKSTLTLSSQASVALMCRTISRGSLATRSSRTSMGGRTTSHVSLASRASSYASQSTMYSVDPDVADIQSRLVIPETVEVRFWLNVKYFCVSINSPGLILIISPVKICIFVNLMHLWDIVMRKTTYCCPSSALFGQCIYAWLNSPGYDFGTCGSL